MSYFLAGNFYYSLCSNVTKKLKIQNACSECKLRIHQNRQCTTRGSYSTPPDDTAAFWEERHLNVEAVAALHQGAPGQMTWLEDPPPWRRPAYCFASVIVWSENKNVTISDRFWHSQRRWRPVFWGQRLKEGRQLFEEKVHPVTWLKDFLTSKWPGSFTALAFAPDDLPHDLSDLEMTWLPWRPGAATVWKKVRRGLCPSPSLWQLIS